MYSLFRHYNIQRRAQTAIRFCALSKIRRCKWKPVFEKKKKSVFLSAGEAKERTPTKFCQDKNSLSEALDKLCHCLPSCMKQHSARSAGGNPKTYCKY